MDSSFTLAARVRNYGGDIEIAKGASLLDDHFELVSFAGEDSFRYLSYLTGVLTNSMDKLKGVSVRKVRQAEFTVAEDRQILIQVDGELAGKLPASVEIVPDAVTLLMPGNIEQRYRSNG
ncbi:MAG: hypothetical protein GY953_35240 [bacterium]|nr:hypothetical protein [bacterium]